MPRLRIIDTTREIRTTAEAWDDLWRRSGVALPTKRAALVAQWIDHFAPRERLIAIVVEEHGEMLAALPLVSTRLGRVLPAARLPVNCWSSAGDLLLDPSCDQERVLACLIEAIRRLPWPLVWLDTFEAEEPRWVAFREACRALGLPIAYRHQFDLGLIDIGDNWSEYQSRWSKNLRQNMRRWLRKARAQGTLRLEVLDDLVPEQVEEFLVSGLEVEDRSWKGPAGTSVLRVPGMRAFFVEQARQLAAWNQLQLAFLRLDDWPIAFEYGYRSEGVHFAHKQGYDEAYGDLAPGRLLMMQLLEHDHHHPETHLVNCMGMLTGALAKWCTRVQPIGRLVVGTGGWLGNFCVRGYREVWPSVQRIRRGRKSAVTPQPVTLGCGSK
jgi:CelD/BcsL family acetyltransferase involved in cellulose biosynthesis